MEKLLKYIQSTFNYKVDIDAKQFSKNASLKIWDKPFCNIYITPLNFPELEYKKEEYYELVFSAVKILNSIMKGEVVFNVTDSLYGADVKIYWAKMTRICSGLQFFEGFHNKSVSIGIMDIDGYIYPKSEILPIILHEFGHILGLGHSPNLKDLMCGKWNPEIRTFSKDDKFVLDLIYSIGSGKTYTECKEYIREKVKNYKYENIQNKIFNMKNLSDDLFILANMNKRNLIHQNINVKRIKPDK